MTTPAPGTLEVKAGDHEPSVQTTLALPGAVPAFNLTNCQVFFLMRLKGADGKPVAGPEKVNALATIVDADAGVVRYDWQSGDTDVPGMYVGEWEVWRAGKRRTFPTRGYNDIVIYLDLGQGVPA